MNTGNKCKYIKVDGASCSLNNNCRYPHCLADQLKEDIIDTIDSENSGLSAEDRLSEIKRIIAEDDILN